MRWLVLAVLAVLLPTGALAADCIVLEDFSRAKVGEFPADWKPRKDSGRAVYTVREEGGRRFLAAVSEGIGIQAAREQPWDIAAYPVLAWAWRLKEQPRGSDERHGKATYVSAYGLDRARDLARESHASARAALEQAEGATARLACVADYILERTA